MCDILRDILHDIKMCDILLILKCDIKMYMIY